MIEQELQKENEQLVKDPTATDGAAPTDTEVRVDQGTEMTVEHQEGEGRDKLHLSRAERRAALRQQNEQQAATAKQADPAMFRTQVEDRAPNPNRVQFCKDWIDFFNRTCTTVEADPVKRKSAATGMNTVFTSLNVLNREDCHAVLDYLVSVISKSNTGAFERRIVFANMKFLEGDARETFHRMIDLMVSYANTEEKAAIRRRTDPTYAVSMYRDSTTRNNIDAYFPPLS